MLKSTRSAALALGLAAASLAAPLHAQQADAPAPAASPAQAPAPSDPAAAPIDPARLEAAQKTIQFIFPAGTYARIMDRTVNGMMKPMLDSMGKLSLKDLAAISGLSEEQLAKMPVSTLEEAMAIMDPAFKERTAAAMPAMFKAMQGLFAEFEPAMQEGLARAYARQFDVAQLAELNTFFATPTGSTYAANSMLIFTDPEIMRSMQTLMPALMKRMPEITKDMEKELSKFPKRKTYDDLTPDERKRLMRLLGIEDK